MLLDVYGTRSEYFLIEKGSLGLLHFQRMLTPTSDAEPIVHLFSVHLDTGGRDRLVMHSKVDPGAIRVHRAKKSESSSVETGVKYFLLSFCLLSFPCAFNSSHVGPNKDNSVGCFQNTFSQI